MVSQKHEALRFLENVIFLRKQTLFSGLETGESRALALIAREVVLADGQVAVREGDAGDSFFIVKEGALRIVKGKEGVELSRVSQGGCFGEMALFEEGLLRSADVLADGPSILLAFQREDLFDVMNRHPGIAIELVRIFSRRLRVANEKLQEQNKGDNG